MANNTALISADDTVLVTGGTGYTGQELIRQLAGLGCRIRVIARPGSRTEALEKYAVELFSGDVFDPDTVTRAADGVHYVFHVAGAFREPGIADHVYHQVHVESTQLLVQATARQPQFKRFVHVSTVGVLGHIAEPPVNEDAPMNPGDIYQETKAEAELWVREFAGQQQYPLTVIRPAAIYGPGDRRLLKLFKMARLPVIPLLGFGKCMYHLIHVEDLARCMIVSATHEKALGNVFICGNPASVTLQEMLTIIAREMGRKALFVRLPATPFFVLGYLCERICKALNLSPPIYRRRVAFFTKDRSFDTRRMQDALDFKYKFDNETGIQQTTRWYISAGWL